MNVKNNKTEENLPQPATLMEAMKAFADEDTALRFMVSLRWPDGVRCPRCGSARVRFISTRRVWECRETHKAKRFSIKTGTIMEESPLSLDKWLIGIWLEANAKNSISSYEVQRSLGITQKSAWFLQQRIRLAMQNGTIEKMGGPGGVVEADETFIGGFAKNMHKARKKKIFIGTGPANKTAVMGLLERHSDKKHSQVRTAVVRDIQRTTLRGVIAILAQSITMTLWTTSSGM
jgi:Transposase zinc-ribbon domain/ISXO2-like transposase domain